ncbi:hypothetical protein DFR50_15722 [Roseiarcus fermentans]|uniref:Uncharacterized protein n=2 Tax=Roseiarcus fermentans TaxID=1473586 RepID=A0A366EHS0_9HYPH|nr:hypothetical protein DFR50_15722 [Roseiarcus fermentans]
MLLRNFTLRGEDLIAEWGHQSPFRMNRLITALEAFVCGGAATRVAPSAAAETEVYLTPPRSILRSVSDAAALVLVDHRNRTVEIIEVINDYCETTEQD